jgi:hypothetical protein
MNLTMDGTLLGTPAYMAPEQFTGDNVDTRTDQFNFCVALYEAIYGERPFDGKSFVQLGEAVCDGKVRPPPAGSRVSTGLRSILLRGLAVRPDDRYPTMEHLLEELGRDRAWPWRRASYISAAVAATLLLGLGADWAVRDRVEAQVRQSFELTGTQIAREGRKLADQFDRASRHFHEIPVMVDVLGYHDQAEFGLGTPEQDAANLRDLHDKLLSQDWSELSDGGTIDVAVIDAKNRVLYASAARPDDWDHVLGAEPTLDAARKSGTPMLATVRYDEQAFAAASLFTARPGTGVAVMFARPLVRGSPTSGLVLEFKDGDTVLRDVALDDATQLALVADDGNAVGTVPAELIAAAPGDGTIGEQGSYLVQARPLADAAGHPFAHVVMARSIRGVLSLFPHARVVFAAAALLAVLQAILTMLRARQVAAGRV